MSEQLLPHNATPLERAIANTMAEVLAQVEMGARLVWDIDNCPAALLPWLAWTYSVDAWDDKWSEEQQRQVIKNSVDVHRYKGTIGAVKAAIGALGLDAQVQEWFNQLPPGEPYTFKLIIDSQQVGVSQLQFMRLLETVQSAKNLRSWLAEVEMTITSTANLRLAAVASVGTVITVTNYVPPKGLVVSDSVICI